nr:histidinol-phosphate aminotransferase [Gemmatimonadota bacterium]
MSQLDLESALGLIKPSVRALGAYTLERLDSRIKLNQNESPYDVPADLKESIRARLESREWNRYPAFVAD